MPWKECSVVEERLKFVVRVIDGEPMTDLCREFGISRKTGYKIFNRYKSRRRWSVQAIGRTGRFVTPTNCRLRSRA